MIKRVGTIPDYFECDICHEVAGSFNPRTGNHWGCEVDVPALMAERDHLRSVVISYNDLIGSYPDEGLRQIAKGILNRHEASLQAALKDLGVKS